MVPGDPGGTGRDPRRWRHSAFYERSIGEIENGHDLDVGPFATGARVERPSALYVSSNLEPGAPIPNDRDGWVELSYGAGGNVTSMTVHAVCTEASALRRVAGASPHEALAASLANDWSCATEQHYEYRWDELNRIAEARRWDRSGGSGPWGDEVARQRYRYDGANQRTVKESFAPGSDTDSRVALYVYPGDYERRGLVRGFGSYDAVVGGWDTETQYLVAGARLVWQPTAGMTGEVDREQRLTMGVTDLLGTTAASVDLISGELLEVSTYYPNGSRETLWAEHDGELVPLEPMGFTGKEADEEVGLVYFGERYLIARLGRWASADPLHVHAAGGGEALNSYHYVAGSLLQARDQLGLEVRFVDIIDHLSARTGGRLNARTERGILVDQLDFNAHTSSDERQASDRAAIVDGIRMSFGELYNAMIDERARAGASREDLARLTRERDLVVGSILDPMRGKDGTWRLRIETSKIDSELGGDTHWVYDRFREVVDSERVVGIGVELVHPNGTSLMESYEWGVSFDARAGEGTGGLTGGIIVSREALGTPTAPYTTGRDAIHEMVIHTFGLFMGWSEEEWQHHDRRLDLDGTTPDARNQADLADDWLRGWIDTPNSCDEAGVCRREDPFRPAPSVDWAPTGSAD